MGGKEVFQRIFNGLKDDKGVYVESLLCILGALAGYSCQASVRAECIERGLQGNSLFSVMGGADGTQYFCGDALNKPLAEMQYSVWGLAGAAAKEAGCETLPDLRDMFMHTVNTISGPGFGIPRVGEEHRASDVPVNYLREIWPVIHPVAKWFCLKPSDWPILYGVAIQEAIALTKTIVDPHTALTIVMESAIPMSKVNIGLA